MPNVVLIGFMGSGKSTVAEKLSADTKYCIVDMDNIISQKAGKSIPEIFAQNGEDYFRDLETQVAKEIQGDNLIVSTGGGVIKRPENIEILNKLGLVITLWVDLETAIARTKENDDRPLLNQDMDKITKLFEDRKQKYLDYGDIIINTNVLTVDEVVKEIQEEIERYIRLGKLNS